MYLTSRIPFLLFSCLVALVLLASQANADTHIRHLRRQADDESSSPTRSPTPSSSPTQSPSQQTTSRIPTSTARPPTSTQESITEEPTSEPPISETPATTETTQAPTSIELITTTNLPEQTTEAPDVLTTVVTVSGSETISRIITSSSRASSTSAPGLNGGESSSGSSGVSPQQRNIIIGVVVGVGGAILIGALGFVAWRIWGKKKHDADDDMYDPNAAVKEPSSSGSAANPFKSTLDQYHNPAPVNTASNF